jgi:hypothetical protein
MAKIKNPHRRCEQNCEREAQFYLGDRFAGGWAGHYCQDHADGLIAGGFIIFDEYVDDPEAEFIEDRLADIRAFCD